MFAAFTGFRFAIDFLFPIFPTNLRRSNNVKLIKYIYLKLNRPKLVEKKIMRFFKFNFNIKMIYNMDMDAQVVDIIIFCIINMIGNYLR